ncbi:uncharacterized protein LOC107037312 [Diachasma alloeum]|uniref:uncharacterized protein LOC107037312 n=1 Tax=Diachasma alloeum TaxID=454923 RepID=UPI00073832A4|nr:uncharacterized protein LOC107037312 [Diachasma alloeum]
MPGLVPGNSDLPTIPVNGEKVEAALSDIMEVSTESSSEVRRDNPQVELQTNVTNVSIGTQTNSTGDSPSLLEAMDSINQLLRSEFDEFNRTLIQYCTRTQRSLNHIRERIDTFLRQQRPSLQRSTGTRSSRLPIQRSQYHLRPVGHRASTSRAQRSAAQRPGPPRSASLGIAGQRSSVIHRRSARSLPHARDTTGFSRNGRTGTSRATPFNLRNAPSL